MKNKDFRVVCDRVDDPETFKAVRSACWKIQHERMKPSIAVARMSKFFGVGRRKVYFFVTQHLKRSGWEDPGYPPEASRSQRERRDAKAWEARKPAPEEVLDPAEQAKVARATILKLRADQSNDPKG